MAILTIVFAVTRFLFTVYFWMGRDAIFEGQLWQVFVTSFDTFSGVLFPISCIVLAGTFLSGKLQTVSAMSAPVEESFARQPGEPVVQAPQVEMFTNRQTSGVIRHIVCICCDRPDINQLKPGLHSMIVDAKRKAGSTLTPNSRITFDSFMDNTLLQDNQSLKMKLMQVFMSTYGAAEAEADALSSVFKGEAKQEDGGSTLAKFFVLYESQGR
jgi:hypothetical protein